MEALPEATLIGGVGIEGDRYATGLGTYSKRPHIDRQVTLIEVEVLEAIARDRGIELAPHEHRRNLTTRGVPLGHLVGQYFRVGDCVLYGGRMNVPTMSAWNGATRLHSTPQSVWRMKRHRSNPRQKLEV